MTLLGKPVPPLDHTPHAAGVPPGVHLNLDAYDAAWISSRPKIKPRIGVVHTNGGGGEGSYRGAIGWSNQSTSNTHAHYNLNNPTPSKNLATDRRSIANSTPKAKELEYGVPDSSFWTISIETADRGYNNGGGWDLGDFLYDHAELVARIIAYESIVWGIPIEIPAVWTGTGWLTHTEPFDGVYTIYTGKSCPGVTKKERVLRGDILPRARQVRDAWTGVKPPPTPTPFPPITKPEEGDMYIIWKHDDHPEVFVVGGGGVIHVDGATRDAYITNGAERVFSDHDGVYESYLRLSRTAG